jgi:hypothetical protein
MDHMFAMILNLFFMVLNMIVLYDVANVRSLVIVLVKT